MHQCIGAVYLPTKDDIDVLVVQRHINYCFPEGIDAKYDNRIGVHPEQDEEVLFPRPANTFLRK